MLPIHIEVVAQVVPIRREDYYIGSEDDEKIILIDENELEEIGNIAPNSLALSPGNVRRKAFGSKLLRDRHSNLVISAIIEYCM